MTSLGLGLGVHRSRTASAAFDWTQFFGVSSAGFVFDGTQSTFTKAGGGVPVDGDAISAVSDVSGVSPPQSFTQTTGSNQPSLSVTNGVSALEFTSADFVSTTLNSALSSSNPLTMYFVLYWPGQSASTIFYPLVSGSGGTSVSVQYSSLTSNTRFAFGGTVQAQLNTQPVGAQILRISHVGNDLYMYAYNMAGVQIANGASSKARFSIPAADLKLSHSFQSRAGSELAFAMAIDADLSASHAEIMSALVSSFGAWK